VASGLVWCALVGCVVLATQPVVERKVFAGKGEPNPIGRDHRSERVPSRSTPFVAGLGINATADPRAADPSMPLFHFIPWPFDWCV
jgi:hypothetical protein